MSQNYPTINSKVQQVGIEYGECKIVARNMYKVEVDVIFFGTLSA
jgi:hypothetical protein